MACFSSKYGGLLRSLLFASLLTISLSVSSVAPDDFDSHCTSFATAGTVNNPNEKVLLDTQFYPSQSLLTSSGEDELWLSLDFDMSTGGTGIDQWIDLSQSATCQHQLSVCGYMAGVQDNWMITQYINISRSGVIELLLNASFSGASSMACSGICRESVRVRIFETNEPDELNRNVSSSYGGNVASLEHIIEEQIVQEKALVPIDISESSTGLYLAIVDPPPGTCVSITRLALFYYICPEQVVNLVKYPETISPAITSDSGVLLEAICVDNAVITSTVNELECGWRGNWELNSATCSCIQGYYYANQSCLACPPGTYKATVGNAESCVDCPNNSSSTAPGSELCACIEGYYRLEGQAVNASCRECYVISAVNGTETCAPCQANYSLQEDGTCLPCPSNSASDLGSEVCTCVPGYHRASTEPASFPCTTAIPETESTATVLPSTGPTATIQSETDPTDAIPETESAATVPLSTATIQSETDPTDAIPETEPAATVPLSTTTIQSETDPTDVIPETEPPATVLLSTATIQLETYPTAVISKTEPTATVPSTTGPTATVQPETDPTGTVPSATEGIGGQSMTVGSFLCCISASLLAALLKYFI